MVTAVDARGETTGVAPAGHVVSGTRGHVLLWGDPRRPVVWHVTPTGDPVGAWASLGPEDATRALRLIEGRAIVGLHRDLELGILDALAQTARVQVPAAYRTQWLDLAALSVETATIRTELDKAVRQQRKAPLGYDHEVSAETLPRDARDALYVVRRAALRWDLTPEETQQLFPQVLNADPVIDEVLARVRLLQWHIRAWASTETARIRREYLHPLGGPAARPLPPRWLGALVATYDAAFTN